MMAEQDIIAFLKQNSMYLAYLDVNNRYHELSLSEVRTDITNIVREVAIIVYDGDTGDVAISFKKADGRVHCPDGLFEIVAELTKLLLHNHKSMESIINSAKIQAMPAQSSAN